MSYFEFSCRPSAISPLFFAARLKADSYSGGTWTEKTSYVGQPLENFGQSLQLVKLIELKKSSVGEPLTKLQLLSSLGLPKEVKGGIIDKV